MPPTDPNSAQTTDAKEKQELSHPAGAHVCLYCGGKIPLLARWRGLRDFCSDQHQQLYWGETQKLAADAIRRQIRSRRAKLQAEEPSAERPSEAAGQIPELGDLSSQPDGEVLEEAIEIEAAPDLEVASDAKDAADQDLPAGNFRFEAAVLLEVPRPDAVDVRAASRHPEPAERTSSKGGTEVEIPKTDFDPTVADVIRAPGQTWLTPLPPQDLPALAVGTAHAIEPSPIDNADLATLSSWLHYPQFALTSEAEDASQMAGGLEIVVEPVAPGLPKRTEGYAAEDSNPAREPESQSLYAKRTDALVVPPTWFPQQDMVPIFREILSAEYKVVRARPGMQAAEQMARCILPVGVNESEEPRELDSSEARSAARTPMGGPATCRFELVNHVVQQRTLRLRRAGIRQLGTYIPQMRLRTLRPRLVRRPWAGAEENAGVVKVSEPSVSIRAEG